ncbi:hypothetical protein [Egicoccus sp. AB-alg6-2]|uniref:hypothetical protein n=1 Tax=Egicoccus sp. AB-alg6-2 TaxID=3242692 RepID=UPI00359CC89B
MVRRTVARVATRRELWNGNREQWRNLVTLDPARNIVMWSVTQHAAHRTKYRERLLDDPPAGASVVRLRTAGEVRRWRRRVLSRPDG